MLNRHAGSVLANKLVTDRCARVNFLRPMRRELGIQEWRNKEHRLLGSNDCQQPLRFMIGLPAAYFLRLAAWWLVELMATTITVAA